MAVLNGGFMGPSDDAVIHMVREALRGPDDVDQLGKTAGQRQRLMAV